MNKLLIVGTGGFGREVANVALVSDVWDQIFFIDDAIPINTEVNGISVIGNSNFLDNYSGHVFVAIGNIEVRKVVVQNLKRNEGICFPNIIHPSCNWVKNELNSVGEGNYIGEGSIATVNVTVGNFNIINLGCLISHDSEIGSFCNLMHGAKITSGAALHNFIKVGAGASILSAGHIESASEIKANAVYK